MQELDSLFHSSKPLEGTLKEQIMAKCLKKKDQVMVDSNYQLLKSGSNDSFVYNVKAMGGHSTASHQRPRSITVEGSLVHDTSLSGAEGDQQVPKWGELANIIKKNLSPSAFSKTNGITPQTNNRFLVKYNKIDLSRTSPQTMAMKPPPPPSCNKQKADIPTGVPI